MWLSTSPMPGLQVHPIANLLIALEVVHSENHMAHQPKFIYLFIASADFESATRPLYAIEAVAVHNVEACWVWVSK